MKTIVGLDLETTGFKAEKGDRIVEFGAQIWDFDSRKKLRDINIMINPLRAIPEDATRVHGIRIEDLVDAPSWEKVAPAAHKLLDMADLLVIHNVNFDAPFITHELMRVGAIPKDVPTFCTMANGRWATGTGKFPKLGELCWALGVPYDSEKGHRAIYDVDCMMQCFFKGIDKGVYKL